MAVTLEIVSQEGWSAVTVRRVAEAVEYAPPVVYEYFSSKAGLMRGVVVEGHRKLQGSYSQAFAEEPKEVLRMISQAHWNFAFLNRHLYQLMFEICKPFPDENINAIGGRIEALFRKLVGDEMRTQELMFNWICLLQGYILNLMRNDVPPQLFGIAANQLFDRAIGRFLASI